MGAPLKLTDSQSWRKLATPVGEKYALTFRMKRTMLPGNGMSHRVLEKTAHPLEA
jgi:hypothetical protein